MRIVVVTNNCGSHTRVNNYLSDTSIIQTPISEERTGISWGSSDLRENVAPLMYSLQAEHDLGATLRFGDIPPEMPVSDNCSLRTKSSVFGQCLS